MHLYINGIGRVIQGKVHHDCTATPSQFSAYRNIVRKRVHDAEMPQRSVQVLGHDNQPVFVPGASSSLQNDGFSDFVVRIYKYINVDYYFYLFMIVFIFIILFSNDER